MVQAGIGAALPHQGIVIAMFDNTAVFQNDDQIGVAHVGHMASASVRFSLAFPSSSDLYRRPSSRHRKYIRFLRLYNSRCVWLGAIRAHVLFFLPCITGEVQDRAMIIQQ
mgnify:CR=1 FL=1